MLLDHLYATVLHDQLWMTYVGRIAFPLFAFELVQGYMHTHDLRRYARRLLVLAVISEIPFDMVAGGTFSTSGTRTSHGRCWPVLAPAIVRII